MNQHFDNSSEKNTDEFEKRLAAINLVAASENYTQIADRFKVAASPERQWPWRWLTAGALTCSVAVLMLTGLDSTDSDSMLVDQSEVPIVENTAALLQDSQLELAGSTDSAEQYRAGTHYVELANPVELPDSTRVEVVSFFWYPCWPCSNFEEQLSLWESELGDDVRLTRMPAIWSTAMRFHARAYYTAMTLGVLDRTHRQFYTEFKKDSATISDEESLQQFFASVGISPVEFFAAYNSQATLDLLQRAESANNAYQIQSTPSLFVAGKYGISPAGAGGFQEMLNVTDYLIEGL